MLQPANKIIITPQLINKLQNHYIYFMGFEIQLNQTKPSLFVCSSFHKVGRNSKVPWLTHSNPQNYRIIKTMTQKFNEAMQQKFMKDLDDIELDSDSQLNDSMDDSYFQSEKKRMEQAMKESKKPKRSVLDQVKKNIEEENIIFNEFEAEQRHLQSIVKNDEKNVIDAGTIEEIRKKVSNQSSISVVKLADEVVEKKMEQTQLIESGQQVRKRDQESGMQQEAQELFHKIEKAKTERQLAAMEMEDQLSSKYEQQKLSEFFSERFYDPQILQLKQKDIAVTIKSYLPKSTYTNLRPLAPVGNILPRNSPEIALRQIKRTKKLSLIASSKGSIKVKYKKMGTNSPHIPPQTDLPKEQNHLEQNFDAHLSKINCSLESIKQLSQQYKPKFINQFPNAAEQNINIDSCDSKSVGDCLETADPNSLRDITLTFEKIGDLRGINQFVNVEQVGLQYNILKNLEGIQNCSKLMQLNVNHNKIKSIKPLRDLCWLRILNIEHNLIEDLELNGGSLEFLYGGHNRIQQITSISSNRYLKKLIVNNNNLHCLQNLNDLYYLEQLNVSHNYLKDLEGINHCILLRILDACNNRLRTLHKDFIYIFLNKMSLSNNMLESVQTLFLPSLEELYLNNNKIAEESKASIYYLPGLKSINLDENELTGFSVVFSFLRFSKNLETLKYDRNDYFLGLREKVRELYEHIIYRNMNKLAILNQHPFDRGIEKYYEGVYSKYLESHSAMIEDKSQKLQQIHLKVMFTIQENKFIGELEERQARFAQTDAFVRQKFIKKSEDLIELMKFQAGETTMLRGQQSVFHQHDMYQWKLAWAVHKIESLFFRNKYNRRLRKRYFQANRTRIITLFQHIDRHAFNCLIGRCIDCFRRPLIVNSQKAVEERAAVVIQKNWRMWRARRRYLRILSRLKQKDTEEDMQEIDLEEFDQFEQFDMELQIPEDFNFEEYIIKPEIFEILRKKEEERVAAQGTRPNKQKQEAQKEPRMLNNFMESHEPQPTTHKADRHQEQIQKIMRNWCIQREAAEAYLLKQQKKQKLVKLEAGKHLSSGERYHRFKNNR